MTESHSNPITIPSANHAPATVGVAPPTDWSAQFGRSLDEVIVGLWHTAVRKQVADCGVLTRWRRLITKRHVHPTMRQAAAPPAGLIALVTGRWWITLDGVSLVADPMPSELDPLCRYMPPGRLRSLGLVGTREGRLWSLMAREFSDFRGEILQAAVEPLVTALTRGHLAVSAIPPVQLRTNATDYRTTIPAEWFGRRYWRIMPDAVGRATIAFLPPSGLPPEIYEAPVLAAGFANPGQADKVAPTSKGSRTGAAGRPSSMHIVRRELGRRMAAEEKHPTMKSYAEALSQWFAAKHPEEAPLTPKAIENSLRDELRKATASSLTQQ